MYSYTKMHIHLTVAYAKSRFARDSFYTKSDLKGKHTYKVTFVNCRCAFSAVTRLLELPRLGCYFIVILLSDVMTIHFFFLVSDYKPKMRLVLLDIICIRHVRFFVRLFQSFVKTCFLKRASGVSSRVLMNVSKCYLILTSRFTVVQVKNTGSWMDIGQSISHFGIMSAQVVFVLLLFALSSVFTHDLDLSSSEERSALLLLQTINSLKYHWFNFWGGHGFTCMHVLLSIIVLDTHPVSCFICGNYAWHEKNKNPKLNKCKVYMCKLQVFVRALYRRGCKPGGKLVLQLGFIFGTRLDQDLRSFIYSQIPIGALDDILLTRKVFCCFWVETPKFILVIVSYYLN